MGRLNKPDVESITGLSPAIAIEQKVNSHNPRSTVGTSTEIYEYLKLLYARIGKTFSPASGKLVKKHQVMDVVNHILGLPTGSTAYIVAPLHLPEGRSLEEHLNILMQQGFYRILYNGEIIKIEDFLDQKKKVSEKKVKLLIDRIKVNENMDDAIGRISDSVQTAFYEGKETCEVIWNQPAKRVYDFVRGLSPYPGAWTTLCDEKGQKVVLKLFRTSKTDQPTEGRVGVLRADRRHLYVSCSDCWLQVDELQLAGKKRMDAQAFLNGMKDIEKYSLV